MHTINIFLASSLMLKKERKELPTFLSGTQLRQLLLEDKTMVNLIRCEDVSKGYKGTRLQDTLNQELEKSQMSVFLIKNGTFNSVTEEEFDVAFNSAKKRANRKGVGRHIMYVYSIGKTKGIDSKIKEKTNGEVYLIECHNIYEVESSFLVELLKYVRDLLVESGERYRYSSNPRKSSLCNPELEKHKTEGDEFYGEYEWHLKKQKSLKINLYRTIDQILLIIGSATPPKSRQQTLETLVLYERIIRWAQHTEYNKEEYSKRMIEYAELLSQNGLNTDAKDVCKALISLVEELFGKEPTKKELSESYYIIGKIYNQMDEWKDALIHYNNAFELQQSLYGENDERTKQTKKDIDIIRNSHSEWGGGKKNQIVSQAEVTITKE